MKYQILQMIFKNFVKREILNILIFIILVSKKKIISSGFKIKKITKKIIIPNYFKPFVQKNIKLRYAFYPSSEKMIFFKGDCDQDRPN